MRTSSLRVVLSARSVHALNHSSIQTGLALWAGRGVRACTLPSGKFLRSPAFFRLFSFLFISSFFFSDCVVSDLSLSSFRRLLYDSWGTAIRPGSLCKAEKAHRQGGQLQPTSGAVLGGEWTRRVLGFSVQLACEKERRDWECGCRPC